MKKQFIYIALAALILPAILRGAWFYRGMPERSEIATPDFASFAAPEAPVNVPETAADDIKQTSGTVLIDGIHANQFYMTEIDALTKAIKARGGETETFFDSTMLEYQLKYASAFISISPSAPYSSLEINLLKDFAERGGRILVFTDATRNSIYYDYISGNPIAYGDANAANSLLAEFGISINNDYLYNTENNEGNFRNVIFDDFGKSELTFGLKEVALYGAHSVESPSGLILLRGPKTNVSSSNDAHDPNQGGAALNEDGNVAAFGDFTFLSSPYSTYTDNATLIANLADFALAGERSLTLANFPFIFEDKTVQLYIAPELTATTELVSALSGLQAGLRYMDIEIEFVSDVPKSGDAIIIGSFAPTEELEPYTLKFDITLDDSEFISTTEFGEIGRYGNGIVLFDTGSKGNTLVLLADTPEDTIALIGLMGSGSMYSCLTSDKIAVCSVGYGGEYYGEESAEETTDETATDETQTEDTPEATPTAGG